MERAAEKQGCSPCSLFLLRCEEYYAKRSQAQDL